MPVAAVRRTVVIVAAVAVAVAVAAAATLTPLRASASSSLIPVSSDDFANATSQHATGVEPDTFSFGGTIVAAFQEGRFTDGGASDIGWSTSTSAGGSWVHGDLPGITTYVPAHNPGFVTGPYERVSDPSVAYDAAHQVWVISSLALQGTSGVSVLVSRSTDGGLSWSNPVTASRSTGGSLDKDWIVCDTSAGRFAGHCYLEWDNTSRGDLILMSTSTDGGASWSAAQPTADQATGLGGQPLVQANGTVVVPFAGGGGIESFLSADGGTSWSSTTLVSAVQPHGVAGGLRTSVLPSAEVDAAGTVYVVWQDCRFESGCQANDIVLSTSTSGTQWSTPVRVPLDAPGGGVDHFIPGIAVDRSTSGSSAHLGLGYYYYPQASCTESTCRLDVGFASSADGGATWSQHTQLAGPMQVDWLASTNQGRMVGDYISTSFAGGTAHPVFAVATAPGGNGFDESMVSWTMPSAGSYQPAQPSRICDTRPVQPGVAANQCNNSETRAAAPIGPGATLTIDVCDGAGSGCTLRAMIVNVTAVGASEPSFLTVYPAGQPPPATSNLNYRPGNAVANLVEVEVGSAGEISITNHAGTVDVVVDREGSVASGTISGAGAGLYHPVAPQRICDTRATQAGVATNQCNNGGAGAPLDGGNTVAVQLTGQGGVPVSAVSAVVLNLTITDTSSDGFLTAWPAGSSAPATSNVNWVAGQTVSNRVVVPVDSTGRLSLRTQGGRVDLVVDANGWYGDGTEPPPPGAAFSAVTPARICDTRADQAGVSTNQCNNGGGGSSLGPGQTMTVQLTSSGGPIPAGTRAAVINVTVTGTTSSGFLTVWPTDVAQPTASDLNWSSGQTVPSLVVVELSGTGEVSVFNHSGGADVIVDVVGYYS